MKRILQLTLAISIFATTTFAQKYTWQKGTSPGGYNYQTVANDPMGIRFYTLANGLTVILSVNKETPRLQTLIATKAGSKSDPETNTGLAHYLEHMLFKGTDQYGSLNWEKEKPLLQEIENLYERYNKSRSHQERAVIYKNIDSISGLASKQAIANEYDKMMTLVGAKGTNAFTSFEQTVYVNDIPSNQIDKWLKVEAERFRNPVFRIFHTELEAVYEEKNRGLDNDGEKVYEALFSNLFKNHHYGTQTTIGTIEHLKNPSLVEIRKYFNTYYVPNNMAVIMVGDCNPDELIAKIDKAFSYMKPSKITPYTFTREEEITKPIIVEVVGPDAESVDIAYRLPGAGSKEATMLNFMGSVLSNGTAGLMDLNLVKKQAVLEASAGGESLIDYSVFYMSGKAKEGQKLEDVKAALLAQVELLKSGKFDNDLLKSIINNYKKSLIQRRESNAGRAYTALDVFITGQNWQKSCEEIDVISKITKQEIQDFASKWFKDNYVAVYKRIGKDEVQKVDKPSITPVEVNRDAQSPFLKAVAEVPATDMKPIFLNYATDINRGKLKNVDVLSVENKTNNLYNLYYHLDMGSWHNKLLPIAVDYLQYLGTKTQNAEAISKQFYKTASDFGVSSGTEETYVVLNGLSENFVNDLTLFENLLKNCVANEDALREMIAGMKKNRADDKLNKGAISAGLNAYARYGKDNPFNYKLSNAELDNIKAAQLIEILRSITSYKHKVLYYGPLSNTALINTLAKVHIVPATFKTTPAVHPFSYTSTTGNQVLFADFDMVQSDLRWIRNGETFNPKNAPVISLFNEYFGGSMSGIVFQDIRESKALAYSAGARFGEPAKKGDPYSMSGSIGCQADKMKESINAMNALLTDLPQSDKMLEQAKTSIRNNISTTRITKAGILMNYLNAQRKGLSNDNREEIFEQVGNLNFSSVNDFYKNNIAGKPYSLCVLGSDAKMNWEELNKFGPVTKLSLTDIFGY
jgi:predicted Zn-dependent peptidase